APFSPSSAVTEPGCSSSDTRSSARVPPKDLRTSASVRSGADTSENLGEYRDVRGVVDERPAHRADPVGAERHVTHAPGGHGFREVPAARELRGHLHGGVPEID